MWLGKRFFDVLLAVLGLIVLSPLFLIISICIKTSSEGPVFFRQKRVGKNEVPFYIHKFRTMRNKTEKDGLKITVGRDPRITSIGHFIRKYKIDEFPQLIDVVLGTMSLVGPRPEVPEYVEKYPVDARKVIFKMRPGITDWASVKFKDENALLEKSTNPEFTYINEVLPIKLKYYVEYSRTSSPVEDFRILWATIFEVFGNKRA